MKPYICAVLTIEKQITVSETRADRKTNANVKAEHHPRSKVYP
jgi:hypothetical protein